MSRDFLLLFFGQKALPGPHMNEKRFLKLKRFRKYICKKHVRTVRVAVDTTVTTRTLMVNFGGLPLTVKELCIKRKKVIECIYISNGNTLKN